MNALKAKSKAAVKGRMEGYRLAMTELEAKEDRAYDDFSRRVLDEEQYRRVVRRIRDERRQYEVLLERANLEITDASYDTAKLILELATDAKSLWLQRTPHER